MAYVKPPLLVRKVFNPLAMALGIGGATTVTVAGRRTGRMRKVPVIPVEHDGDRYLVSTRGESEWVRNLRGSGRGELRRRGKVEPFEAVEIPVEERAPVIATYRDVAGRTVDAYWKQLPDPADHPVFRITAAPGS